MRKTLILLAFSVFAIIGNTNAQLSISLNIGTQPAWGPEGYDHVDNYYLPEVDAYYNVQRKQYTYQNGSRWVTTSSLPQKYRNVDMYKTYKVVVNGNKPYMNHQKDMQQYGSYRNKHDQRPIRDSKDQKYYANPGHPQHGQWEKQQHQHNDHDHH